MAFPASKPAPAKQLREHLQDQQEPFNMASYLSERRYMKSLNSNNQSVDSTKNQMRSHHFDKNKGRKRILFTTKSLASIVYKLIPTKNSEELSNCTRSNKDDEISETIRKTWRIEKRNWIFSIKCLNAYRLTDSNVKEHSLHSKRHPVFTHASTSVTFNIENLKVKTAADAKFHWMSMEGDMQLSAASLLTEAISNKGSDFITDKEAPSSNTSIPNKRDAGDFMLSASLWEVLKNSPIEEKSHVGFAKKRGINWTCSQYLRNKRLLQQRKQLLLHPMKEAKETQGRKGESHKYTDDISEPEDMEEIIYKQICSLGKPSGDFMNITHLMNFDLSSTLEEWSNFQQLKRKIGTEIGDEIMGEIVEEIIELFFR
ncbi:hypothetical protein SO802_028945 [Lithocarpus litseifolius]|uniref:DUF4378 domain-containing protein n=1 Tax=Lithocarpus litseifolius TaxID=425828 RepID=A0AAW2BTN9_9ROSI